MTNSTKALTRLSSLVWDYTPLPLAEAEILAKRIDAEFVVIPKADIPEVIDEGSGSFRTADNRVWFYTDGHEGDAERYHTKGVAYLAMAAHLEANPPEPERDAEQIAKIKDALVDTLDRHLGSDDLHMLYDAGVRIP